MEHFYRIILLGLFVLGFVGAVASADHNGDEGQSGESAVTSLIRDVRLAEEVNDINAGRWNQDVANSKEDGLARVESLINSSASSDEKPTLEDATSRAKSELAE